MNSFPKRLKFIFVVITFLVVGGYLVWQKYKYKIVRTAVVSTVLKKTNNLYLIKYDSLSFDEITGNASIKNIHIIPDTNRIKNLSVENLPDILLDVTVKSLEVKGVKTADALLGKELSGDSVIIDQPNIKLYSLKLLQKGTKIEQEAGDIYKQILGNLNLIKVRFVFVNNVNVTGIDFYSKTKNFDFINGKFFLEDILIDSAHHLDTSRILFCKRAAFTVDSFFSYNNNRRELSIRDINFLGKKRQLLFNEISLERFQNDTSKAIRLLDAKTLRLAGLNTNEIVKNKNIVVDSILCKDIIVYQLPAENLKSKKADKHQSNDSTGFKNVYSVLMQHLRFPKVTFVPFAKSNFSVGNIAIKINGVNADKMANLEKHPSDYTREVEIAVSSLSMKSSDNAYNFIFQNATLNSLRKELKVNSFNIVPFAGEKAFADKFAFQKDRYDVKLRGISLKNIVMNNLINKKLLASELVIDQTNAKIYRDLHKPIERKNKVGNYPSQLLFKLDVPIDITKVILKNADIEYRENEKVSDSIGAIRFTNSRLTISNITNMPDVIRKNKELNIQFESKALGHIPLNGNFRFSLDQNTAGNFSANGHTSGFDALGLNKVSVPMALVRIKTGTINSIDFKFTGDNTSATGDFVMQYENLKVNVLKRDKETKEIKKKGLASLAANLLVKNNNPGSGGLIKANPEEERDINKSFFNLIWKTMFKGIKETVGLP